MALSPSVNLTFDGRCEAAFQFYEKCLGGKIGHMLTWGDSPMAQDAPEGWREKILFARLTLGDIALLGCDVPPPSYKPPGGFGVVLNLNDPDEAERLFAALKVDGTVHTPLQETFWAARYGGVTDRFGIPWEINCGKP